MCVSTDEKFLFKRGQDFSHKKMVNWKCQKHSFPDCLLLWELDLLLGLICTVLNSTKYTMLSVIQHLAFFVLIRHINVWTFLFFLWKGHRTTVYPGLRPEGESMGKKGHNRYWKVDSKIHTLKKKIIVFCFHYPTCMKLLPSPTQLLSQELCVTADSCSSNHNLPMLWGRLESDKEQEKSEHQCCIFVIFHFTRKTNIGGLNTTSWTWGNSSVCKMLLLN